MVGARRLAERWGPVGSDSRRGGEATRLRMLDGGCDDPEVRWFDAGCTECRCDEERKVTALVSV